MIDYAAEYDNSARVENSEALLDAYIEDAAAYREEAGNRADLDVSYGPKPRNYMDIFWPGEDRDAPMVMFVHGGYWQRMDRTAFSHMAKGLNEHGITVVLPSYTLAPDISMNGIINEIRRACLVLNQTHGKRLTLVGHSAGGHLAACMLATDWEGIHSDLPPDLVASAMGISGLYDLLPLLHTSVNDPIGMDQDQAIAASPVRWVPQPLQRFEAWVGSEESSEYHRQSQQLAERWNMLGTPTRYISDPGTNHFTIIHALTRKNSLMVKTILELVENPTSDFQPPEPADQEVEKLIQGAKVDQDSDQDANAAIEEKPDQRDESDTDETNAPEER